MYKFTMTEYVVLGEVPACAICLFRNGLVTGCQVTKINNLPETILADFSRTVRAYKRKELFG